GASQWVFYWHYTLPSMADGRQMTPAQEWHRKLRRKTGSVTIEVFAPETSARDAEGARAFVAEVDAAGRRLLPEGWGRGGERKPVKYVGEGGDSRVGWAVPTGGARTPCRSFRWAQPTLRRLSEPVIRHSVVPSFRISLGRNVIP